MSADKASRRLGEGGARPGDRPRGSLSRRLFISFLVVALVPLMVASAVSYYTARKSLRQAAEHSLRTVVSDRAAFIESWFHDRMTDLRSKAQSDHTTRVLESLQYAYETAGKELSEFVKSYQWHMIDSELTGDFKTFHNLYGYYDIFLIDLSGNILYSIAQESDLGTNLFDEPLAETRFAAAVRETLTSGQQVFSDLEEYAPSNNIVAGFLVDVVLSDDGDKIGAIAFQLAPDQIERVMHRMARESSGVRSYVIGYSPEHTGVTLRTMLSENVIFHDPADPRQVVPRLGEDYLSRRVETAQTRLWMHEHGSEGTVHNAKHDPMLVYRGPNGESVLGTHKSITLAGVKWGMIAEIPESVAFASINTLRTRVLGLVVATGVLVVGVTIVMTGRIVRPIRRLSSAANRVAQGDLTHMINSSASDEIGVLSRSFDSMVMRLGRLFENLSNERNALDQHAIVSVADVRGNIIYVNDKFCDLSGYSRDELIGHNHSMVKSDEHSREFYRTMWKAIASGRTWSGEIKNRAKNGHYYWVDATIVPFMSADGKITKYVAIRTDITARKEHEEQLYETNGMIVDALKREKDATFSAEKAMERFELLASTDKLTGLPNRMVFLDRLNQRVKQTDRDQRPFAVLFFDFDRFKVVNDCLGHDAGDALLCDIARIFRRELRDRDTVARFGGDEFVVLLTNLTSWSDAHAKAKKLLDAFAEPHEIGRHLVVSTASIGLVTNERAYKTAGEMIRDADAAMYQAKENGRGRVVTYDEKMHANAMDRLMLEQDLRTAVAHKQLHLLYQPIVEMSTGELRGFEALIRWEHPTRGMVSPGEFIPIAEDTGLIVEIGRWVLQTAAHQIGVWNRQFGTDSPLTMNVNVSKRQLQNESFLNDAVASQVQHGLGPGILKLEITESTIAYDPKHIVPLLEKLRDGGFPIVMDDFGTGVSSLAALHEYPIDVLKIDQSFIRALDRNRSLLAVVASIVALSENLGITTVAEGIEEKDIVGALQSIGCVLGQGFYFGRPLTRAQAEEFIMQDSRQNRRAA